MMILEARCKNGFGFRRLGLETGVKNYILWSEIGSGFEDPGGTPPPRNPRSAPRDGICRPEGQGTHWEKTDKGNYRLFKMDQLRFLRNCPPTPPQSQHFALSEK